MKTQLHPQDHTVDRILIGLRDTTPPAGMEQRILNTLEAEERRAVHRETKRQWLNNFLHHVIPSAAQQSRGMLAFRDARTGSTLRWLAIAAVAIVLIGMHTRHQSPSLPALNTAHQQPQTADTSLSGSATPQPVKKTVTTPANPSQTAHTMMPASEPQRNEPSETEDTTAHISHPAPPLPITAQEQLLLRYARRGRTEDLAQISTERKAAKEDQEAADFQAFFEPPVVNGESE